MSTILVNSCGDKYATAQIPLRWSVVTGSPTVLPISGRRDGGAIQLSTASVRLQQNLPGAVTYIVGIAAKLSTLVATDLLTFREGSTDHVIVRITATGAIQILRAPSTQLGITAGGFVIAGFFNYFEVLATIDGAAGVVTLNFNSVQALNLTSQNTDNGGAVPEIDNIEIEGSTGILTIDDNYYNDTLGAAPQNGIMGDTRIEAVVPVADGFVNDFPTINPAAPTTHWDKVDDSTPDDSASFVASEVGGDQELFDMETLPDPGATSAIYAVQLVFYARKDKVTAKSFLPLVRSGGSNFNGTTKPLSTSFIYYTDMFQQNPDTAADWIESEVNSAEFGVEVL